MKNDDLKHLSNLIANRRCVLFAGAGLTSEDGGATWPRLVQYLVEKFNYSSPLSDNFQIVGDICRKNDYNNVYAAIQNRLKHAKIADSLINIVTLPWFTVFTTNYDLGLETALTEYQKISVRTVLRGDEFSLTGFSSEILCVKLMGSLDIPSQTPGSMVIDPGDMIQAEVNRSQIFDLLERHAANLSFLFIGYSFDDGIFIKILEKLNKILGNPTNTHFAVFKDQPTPEKLYLFDQHNVKVIVNDLKDFVQEISRQVSLQNPQDFSLKSLRIGKDIVPIKTSKISGFLAQYNPVLSEDFNEYINPNSFFKGYSESLNPFELKWHFHRDEIDTIVKAVIEKNTRINEAKLVSVEGNPGSGRTFSILASVYKLITEHRSVAIKIQNFSIRPLPNAEEFSNFIEEINKATKEADAKPPENFIFWADFSPSESLITQFLRLAHNTKQAVTLIYEDLHSTEIEFKLLKGYSKINVDMDADLSSTKKTELTNYLIDTIKKHKLPEASKDEIERIIAEEQMFLPIMYRTIDPARRSINKIIEQELFKITDPDVQRCVYICSLASTLDLDIPVAIMRGAINRLSGKNYTYSDVFFLALKKAGVFIKDYQDFRFDQFFSIYHPVIARKISDILGKDQMNKMLCSLAEAVDIRTSLDAHFIGALLIEKGVNKYKKMPLPFSQQGLEAALLKIKDRQPARPVLHHLARFYADNDMSDTRIVPLLEEALSEPRESYMLYEKKGNVLTTLARIKWCQSRERLAKLSRNDKEIEEIMGLLDAARIEEIQNVQAYNVHAYDLQARILKELARSTTNEATKLALINEAISIVMEGIELYGDDPESEQRLKALLIELFVEITAQGAEDKALELFKNNDGVGYYTLATIEYYKNSDHKKAEQLLDLAMQAKNFPALAITLKIEINLLADSPDYKKLLALVTALSARNDFHDNWKSLYYKGVVYATNGNFKEAYKQFYISNKKAPRYLQRRIQLFWKENGRRKRFQGKVFFPLTEREGRIYSHNIPDCLETIFFDPRTQTEKQSIMPGLAIVFELGFSPKGPIAFDVRPYLRK